MSDRRWVRTVRWSNWSVGRTDLAARFYLCTPIGNLIIGHWDQRLFSERYVKLPLRIGNHFVKWVWLHRLREDDDVDGRRISAVYHWENGMTMVFDQFGQQMPEFQGRTEDVAPKLRDAGWSVPVRVQAWPSPPH